VKIAHIIKDLDIGGIQTLLLDLCHHYNYTGQAYVLIVIGIGEMKSDFEQLGSHCHFIPKKYPFIDFFLIKKVRQLLVEEKVDIVHAHHVSEGITAYFASRFSPIKMVQSFHAAPQISNKQDRFIFKILTKLCDAGISPSHAQLNTLEKCGFSSRNIKVIHNGLRPERFGPYKTMDMKKELGLSDEHILLGMIGNFYNDTRDQLTICKALPDVFNRYPNARFVFWGGYQNKYIKHSTSYEACVNFCKQNAISEKVIFNGLISPSQNVFKNLDFYVYSSLHDTFGMAVIEAMFNKIPLIVNDLDVMQEVIGDDANAYFYPTKNPKMLGQTIISAIENVELTTKKIDAAYQRARTHFHINNHADSLNVLYNQLITKR